jgi:UDP-glucose 4-epimerase
MCNDSNVILGARGFIGSQIFLHKKRSNSKVRGYARSKDLNYEKGVIENLEVGVNSLHNIKINENDIIYDCIGLKTEYYGMNLTEFESHKSRIIEYYEKLCDHIDKNKARKLVFISSSGALFNTNQSPGRIVTEESNPIIVDGYGASTQIVEQTLINSQLFSKGKIVIVRPTNLFGSNQTYKNNQGLIPRIFQALVNDEIISITNNKNEVRDYLYIEDFLEAIDLIVDEVGIYNISSQEMKSGFDVLESIGKVMAIHNSRARVLLRNGDKSQYSPLLVSSEKLRLRTKWKPKWNFENAIQKTIEHYFECK